MVKHRSHVCWQVAVEVNTTQEALCCQSSAPNQKLCQANTTCIIKVGLSYYFVLFQIYLLFTVMLVQDLDGTVAYSKHCTVTQDNKFEFPNRSHEQSEVEICECMIIIIII